MTTKYTAQRFLLHEGGELFINKTGSHWSVDVFAADWSGGDPTDPVYHAFYDTESDALADADSWKKWDES